MNLGLLDSRNINPSKCLPSWRRADKYSKIDYILTSEQLFNFATDYRHDWAFDKSDHCAIILSLEFPSEIVKGKGYYKIDTELLNNPDDLEKITTHIESISNRIDNNWDPHTIWEYYKMEIRNIFIECESSRNSNYKFEIQSLEKELNDCIEWHKKKLADPDSMRLSLNDITDSIEFLESKLNDHRIKQAERLLLRSKINYTMQGEKCSKYFLNMLKHKTKKSYIPSIKINNNSFQGKEMGKQILNFYSDLYKKDENIIDPDTYINIPDERKLNDDDALILEAPLTLEELYNTLKTCKDSSPGLDAIPYSLYKKYWYCLGTPLLNSWNYSVSIGRLAPGQRHSVISLLQKPGKPVGLIDNL